MCSQVSDDTSTLLQVRRLCFEVLVLEYSQSSPSQGHAPTVTQIHEACPATCVAKGMLARHRGDDEMESDGVGMVWVEGGRVVGNGRRL